MRYYCMRSSLVSQLQVCLSIKPYPSQEPSTFLSIFLSQEANYKYSKSDINDVVELMKIEKL